MPFVTFKTREASPRVLVGAVDGDVIVPLAGEAGGRSLKALLHLHEGNLSELSGTSDEQFNFDEIDLLPVIPSPGKIFCVGLNYHAHRIERTVIDDKVERRQSHKFVGAERTKNVQ